jgi:hypothetical protein
VGPGASQTSAGSAGTALMRRTALDTSIDENTAQARTVRAICVEARTGTWERLRGRLSASGREPDSTPRTVGPLRKGRPARKGDWRAPRSRPTMGRPTETENLSAVILRKRNRQTLCNSPRSYPGFVHRALQRRHPAAGVALLDPGRSSASRMPRTPRRGHRRSLPDEGEGAGLRH